MTSIRLGASFFANMFLLPIIALTAARTWWRRPPGSPRRGADPHLVQVAVAARAGLMIAAGFLLGSAAAWLLVFGSDWAGAVAAAGVVLVGPIALWIAVTGRPRWLTSPDRVTPESRVGRALQRRIAVRGGPLGAGACLLVCGVVGFACVSGNEVVILVSPAVVVVLYLLKDGSDLGDRELM